MTLILLGGNSASNKTWIDQVAKELRPAFDDVKIQPYRHWEDEEPSNIDLEYEMDALAAVCRDLTDYCIFAKSAGAILTLKALNEKKIAPQKCIFVGTAILWALAKSFPVEVWLKQYSLPTLFIQHSMDPAMHFSELERFLEIIGVTNHKLVELPGKSHNYTALEELKKLALDFFKK